MNSHIGNIGCPLPAICRPQFDGALVRQAEDGRDVHGALRRKAAGSTPWIATGPRRGREEAHATAVVTYHASPARSLTVKACLTCLWISRNLDEEHPGRGT